MKHNVHVVRHEGGWAHRIEGNGRVSRIYPTQSKAIAGGRDAAIGLKSELYIHGRNGQIREANSYGNDPFPPRG